jgi:RNA polymerase sigma-70 factor (ECF subfamily)
MLQEGSVAGNELVGLDGSEAAEERDEEIAAAARTDPRAFELLYRRHNRSVFRFLRARTPSNDEAAELTAVVFERALAAIGRYRPQGGGVIAWLFTIARNAAVDAERSRRRQRSVTAPEPEPQTEPQASSMLEDAVLERERLADLRDRVQSLPAVQRDAVVLRYAGGLTAREIGGTLGKSEAAAQKILSRALDVLRESYRDDA